MKERRKGAVFRKFILAVLLFFLMMIAGYFFLAFYYRSGFSLNTWINGIYCTGKTVEEVNEELLSQTEAPILVIHLNSGWDSIYQNEIDMGEMDYECDYLPVLKAYMEQQNPLLWVDNILLHREHVITPQITYDEDALREAFEQTCVRHYSETMSGVYTIGIDWKFGWWNFDGLTHQIDMDRAFELLKEAVAAGIYEINIDEMDCFYDIPFTEEQERIRDVWERLEAFQNCDIVYDMGDENIEINPELAAHFLKYEHREDLGESGMDFPVMDENGQFVLDEEAVREYVATLAEEYDTYGKDREFMSTRGDLVTVPAGGTYGTLLDQEAEVAYLMENLLKEECHAGEDILHIPAYEMQGVARGRNDIGSTYIEVDMTQQKMYYYEEGELVIETDIVTGNTGRRMGTPQGVNFVYNKQRNRVLRGPGYASRVSYWVPVKGNIGIHDASWRSEFGGELYQTDGSHGCVNTPTDAMAELYERVEIGTPVVMFY